MLSYLGYIDSTNVYNAYLEYIEPFFDFGKAKKRISNYDKRNNNKNKELKKNVENRRK